ncbi:alcohol dehydrogenase 2 [Fusarium sp. NRRL 52700]|nr:alcohol dehydrogenase 2 [Fusarium sp. NRRL 52700]
MAIVSNTPPSHQAAVYDKPGELSTKVVNIETHSPSAGEVLVKLSHSGVCHSDLSIMKNSWGMPFSLPDTQIGGHEGVGTVVQIGEGADMHGFAIGDRVGVKWLRDICGSCVYCIAGEDGLCAKQSVSGMFNPGTFQQYLTVPARYLTPIPDGVSSEVAAPMLCAGLTSYAALRKVTASPGDWVVVSGAGGGLGHLVTQIAAKAFGYRVVGIDQAGKEDVVKESGAEIFIDAATPGEELVSQVKKLADNLGANAVVVCASSNAAYAQGLELLRPGGTLVGVGMPGGKPVAIASAMPGPIVQKQLKIVGSILGNRQDAIDVLNLAARGVITVHYQTRRLSQERNAILNLERQLGSTIRDKVYHKRESSAVRSAEWPELRLYQLNMSTHNPQLPSPPTTACIGLSATALITFSILLFPALYVAYKHRKTGQAWFPPFIIFFIFRISSDIYYLSRRNEPDIPTAYAMIAAAASTATLSVTIIGIIYEALNLPLFPYKRQRNRIVVVAMNVIYNIGTILAAYGGMRDTTMPDNLKNGAADKAGNIIMFLVMIGTMVWLYPAGKHIYYARKDVSYRSAEVLMMAAAPATVLQLIRMNYDLIYSFTQVAMLHPTTGAFAIRFITFSLQLAIVGMIVVAGWFSKDAATIRARVLKTDSTSELV